MTNSKSAMAALMADLTSRIEQFAEAARKQGREDALAEVRSLVGGAVAPVRRGPGRPKGSKNATPGAKRGPKPGRRSGRKGGPRKNPWAGLSDEARLARVNAIRKGRGLPLKTSL